MEVVAPGLVSTRSVTGLPKEILKNESNGYRVSRPALFAELEDSFRGILGTFFILVFDLGPCGVSDANHLHARMQYVGLSDCVL